MTPEQEELVVAHMDMVGQAAHVKLRALPPYILYEDLQAAGYLGLVKAAVRFDGSRSIPFGAFAVRYINGAISDHLRRDDWVSRARRREERERGLEPDRLCHMPDHWDGASTEDPERDVIQGDELRRMHEAIAALPDERERLILTGVLRGCKMKEFADQFGCTESRISQLRTDAIQRLRRQLVDVPA